MINDLDFIVLVVAVITMVLVGSTTSNHMVTRYTKSWSVLLSSWSMMGTVVMVSVMTFWSTVLIMKAVQGFIR